MALYICGDIHGSLDIQKLNIDNFPEQKNLTKDDYLVILGDFGLIWDYKGESKEEKYWLKWFNEKKFTTLFIDGNHENFTRIEQYPKINFHGGCAHKIRDSIFHLERGYVFEISDTKCFVMGGAQSHDIQDGILNPEDYSLGINDKHFKMKLKEWVKARKLFRIKNVEWWPQELPSDLELIRGLDSLKAVDYNVDFIFSHCAPTQVAAQMGYSENNFLTNYFNKLSFITKYKEWHFGHYHQDRKVAPNFYCHYRSKPWRIA